MKDKFIKFSERYTLQIGKPGFSLWDNNDNRWILDASCLVKDNVIRINKDKTTEKYRCRFNFNHHFKINPFKKKEKKDDR